MFLESIEYTATLIDYVARQVNRSIPDVASVIGEQKIFNLCHNAPMNRHLPMSRIAKEVIHDNDLPGQRWAEGVVEDPSFGRRMAARVASKESDKHHYASVLYELLLDI